MNWGWPGGEGHLGAPGLVRRQAHQLGQLHRLVQCIVVGNTVAHHQQWPAGVHQQFRRPADALLAGAYGIEVGPGRYDVHLGHPLQRVGGKTDVDRPLRVSVGLVERPPDHAGNLVRMGELHGPFGHGSDQVGQIGDGLVGLADVVVGRGNHHRRTGVQGVQHQGDPVGQPTVDVEADE